MTRHGMGKSSAAGLTPPTTDPHASVVIIAADRVATSRVPCRQSRADAQTKRPARIDRSTLWLRSRHRTNQP